MPSKVTTTRTTPTQSTAQPSTPGARPPPEEPRAQGWAPASGTGKGKKVVSLTFDDGPHAVNTPKVLDILKQFGVKATFFVTGEAVTKNPALLRRIVEEGHSLGNHTWDHPNLSKLGREQIQKELDRTQAAVDKALGRHYELTMIRPPYGAGVSNVKNAAPGKDVVMWNVDSNDWRFRNDDKKILQNVFEGSSSVHARGGTILMHDIHPQTVRVLDDVIARLQASGFDIKKVDEVLAAGRRPVS